MHRYFGAITVYIDFKEFAYTEITQNKEYPADSLFGEVGGQLGLFLGASLMTVVEMLDFILVSFCQCCKGRRRHEKNCEKTSNSIEIT